MTLFRYDQESITTELEKEEKTLFYWLEVTRSTGLYINYHYVSRSSFNMLDGGHSEHVCTNVRGVYSGTSGWLYSLFTITVFAKVYYSLNNPFLKRNPTNRITICPPLEKFRPET